MKPGKGAITREIKARLNILDIVRRYVELRRAGNRWVAPCPFHNETKPSFSINEHDGFFYCFGCQAAGDVFEKVRHPPGHGGTKPAQDRSFQGRADAKKASGQKHEKPAGQQLGEKDRIAAQAFGSGEIQGLDPGRDRDLRDPRLHVYHRQTRHGDRT